MPHLSRALQLRRSFIALGRRNAALPICDRLAAGMVGLDEGGHTIFADDAARRMSAQDRRFGARSPRLPVRRRPRGEPAPGGASARCCRRRRRRRRSRQAAGRQARAAAMVAARSRRRRRDALTAQRGTLFVHSRPASPRAAEPQLAAEMFRIPLGSATLLAALASGEELNAYAERGRHLLNTVSFHLKTAYARIGVRRQSDLVRLVTAALRDLAEHCNQTAVRPSLLAGDWCPHPNGCGEGTSGGFNPFRPAPCGATRCRSDLRPKSPKAPIPWL